MLPIQDEIMVSFILADRLADAARARLVRAFAPPRSSPGRRTVGSIGHVLVRLGSRLEAAGDHCVTRHQRASPAPTADQFAHI